MKAYFITLLCVVGFFQLSAQKAQLEWGDTQTLNKSTSPYAIFGTEKLGYYILDYSHTIYHYGKDLDVKSSTDLSEILDENRLAKILIWQDRLYVFSQRVYSKKGSHVMYVTEVDPLSLEILDEKREVARIDAPSGFINKTSIYPSEIKPYASLSPIGEFRFSISSDSSKLLLAVYPPAKDKKLKTYSYENGELIVFGEDMEERWREKMGVFPDKALGAVRNPLIDNEGNLHLLSDELGGKEFKEMGAAKVKHLRYRFYTYDPKQKEAKAHDYVFDAGDKNIRDRSFIINKRGELVVAGVYTRERYDNPFDGRSFGGYCFFKVDPKNQQMLVERYEDFDAKFLAQKKGVSESKLKAQIQKGEHPEYDHQFMALRATVDKEDGGLVLILESNSSQSKSPYKKISDNIWILSINPDGELAWSKDIKKRQVIRQDYGNYLSFSSAVVKDKLYFLYNDHTKNTSLSNSPKTLLLIKNARLALVSVDMNGEMNKQFFPNLEGAKLYAIPKLSIQTKNDYLIFAGQFGKNRSLGKITFP